MAWISNFSFSIPCYLGLSTNYHQWMFSTSPSGLNLYTSNVDMQTKICRLHSNHYTCIKYFWTPEVVDGQRSILEACDELNTYTLTCFCVPIKYNTVCRNRVSKQYICTYSKWANRIWRVLIIIYVLNLSPSIVRFAELQRIVGTRVYWIIIYAIYRVIYQAWSSPFYTSIMQLFKMWLPIIEF